MLVTELTVGRPDSAGAAVEEIYVKQAPVYAIYRTGQRVMVQFADDTAIQTKQRSDLIPLAPLRGTINSLIDGWRTSKRHPLNSKARCYDRQVADALAVAFTPDIEGASKLLEQAKAQIVEERTSWGRFQYLTVASVLAIIVVVAVGFVQTVISSEATWLPIMAIGSGTVGAFFSIAIGIRKRTILPDTHSQDNAADAILRVVIGFIAAVFAIGLVQLGAISLSFGNTDAGTAAHPLLFALLVAFLAGFSERLIPDLLDKAAPTQQQNAPAPVQPHPAAASAPAAPQIQPAVAAAVIATPPEQQVHAPDCLSDGGVQEHEATADIDLPPSQGGVALVGAH